MSLGDMAANEKRYKKIEMKEIVDARKNRRLNNAYNPRNDSVY